MSTDEPVCVLPIWSRVSARGAPVVWDVQEGEAGYSGHRSQPDKAYRGGALCMCGTVNQAEQSMLAVGVFPSDAAPHPFAWNACTHTTYTYAMWPLYV